jgi:glucose/arabinose dehydrogenase
MRSISIYNRVLTTFAVIVLSWSTFLEVISALPPGFIAEVVSKDPAISGTFVPNPRGTTSNSSMLLLSSKEGRVAVLENPDESDESTIVLDMSDDICDNGERGLQAIAVHPQFNRDKGNYWIYLYYTEFKSGCLDGGMYRNAYLGPSNVVARFLMDPNSLLLDKDSKEEIWRSPPGLYRYHQGGAMAFGVDGKLYVSTGDSYEPDVAQQLTNTFGSIVRLNPDDGSIPADNPFSRPNGHDSYLCSNFDGYLPPRASVGAICGEVFHYGFRNPFRIVMNPKFTNKVVFTIHDVGANDWEEISMGGTDYAGRNYGWPLAEGVCRPGSLDNCPVLDDPNIVEPFHYYAHRDKRVYNVTQGGCITGGAFVPEGVWPRQYKYLFIDFNFLEVYNLMPRPKLECRTCSPPIPGFKNTTFYKSRRADGKNVNSARMTDLFFGPYKDTQALYIIKYGNFDTVVRVRYNGNLNAPPRADFSVPDRRYAAREPVAFVSSSKNTDGEYMTFLWDFGDGNTSTKQNPRHSYALPGEYQVTLVVTDINDQSQQTSKTLVIGQPPQAKILSPGENEQFYVGQVLRLHGTATDSNGNTIPRSRIEWEVRQHHASKSTLFWFYGGCYSQITDSLTSLFCQLDNV